MTSLANRLDSFPEGWRPKPGDKLIGVVTDVDSRQSEYDDDDEKGPYKIITVEAEEGSTQDGEMIRPGTEMAWHAFHTMARNEVEKHNPQIDDHVGVAYHGKGEAKPGMHPPERWRLIVDQRGDTPSKQDEPGPDEDDSIPF